MPRDLFCPDFQILSADTTALHQNGCNESTIHQEDEGFVFGCSRRGKANGDNLSDLHPIVQTLSLSDLDMCVSLENAAFPAHERCSEEKFIYRLTTCPELSLGLFSVTAPDGLAASTAAYAHARPSDSTSPTRKSVLVAQVIATRCATPTVTDESMEFPPDWRSGVSRSEGRGHQEQGRTIAIHSLASLPEFKGRGLGKIIMKSYMQRMESSGIADRMALLAHGPLVKYYETLGFRDLGKSEVKFGGGGWNDMVYDISEKGPVG
ncbi:MAG: hypothetical protein Q9201_006740 [Fulgogasparrea decipioides]